MRVGTIFEDSHAPLHKWLQAIHLMCVVSKKGISSHQLHRTLGGPVQDGLVHEPPHPRGHARRRLDAPDGRRGRASSRSTRRIYGRASTHPKGRGPIKGITNSAHKNVILSLVERGGERAQLPRRGQHRWRGHSRSSNANVAQGNRRHDRQRPALQAPACGSFASHDRVDHSKDEYVRYEDRPPTDPHQHRRRLLLASSSAACAAPTSTARRSTCTAIWRSSISATTTASRLGVEDKERATKAIVGAKGKRLTYRTTGETEHNKSELRYLHHRKKK